MLSQTMINMLQEEIEALRRQVTIEEETKLKLFDEMRNAEEKYEKKVKELKMFQKTIYEMKNMLKNDGVKTEDLGDEWTV